MTLSETQKEILEWSHKNFGRVENSQIPLRISSLLGMVEELGELSHAILKWAQGEHKIAIQDSIADLLVFTLDFCGRNDMDAEELLNRVWSKVKLRDWNKNKLTGGEG
jgi:NTP pyrophosphatase (non-canonical NTP hydrolase)